MAEPTLEMKTVSVAGLAVVRLTMAQRGPALEDRVTTAVYLTQTMAALVAVGPERQAAPHPAMPEPLVAPALRRRSPAHPPRMLAVAVAAGTQPQEALADLVAVGLAEQAQGTALPGRPTQAPEAEALAARPAQTTAAPAVLVSLSSAICRRRPSAPAARSPILAATPSTPSRVPAHSR